MSFESTLSRLTRYDAFFEMSIEVNTCNDIANIGNLMAGRLKYIADIYSWRYFSVEDESIGAIQGKKNVLVIDGYRGKASLEHLALERLSKAETSLWQQRKASYVDGSALLTAKSTLSQQFQKPDIVQLYVIPLFNGEILEGMFIFSKRREPFNELDVKFATLAAICFHRKAMMLWEHKKLRDLETAYLQQEINLRQNEKLATLGKLSAGMAHELNNPAAATLSGTLQLNDLLTKLQQTQYALGSLALTSSQAQTLDVLTRLAQQRATQPASLSPLQRSDLERDLEDWLEESGVEDAWQFASTLVDIDYPADDLAKLSFDFPKEQLSTIVAALSNVYATHKLLAEMSHGAKRVTAIVKGLKSYAYLDQAPMQMIDIHEGLNDTLMLLRSKLEGGVSVQREYTMDLPQVYAYGSELNQVWTNIIDNAVAAMNQSGCITLRTFQEDSWLVVEIEDSGSGIPVAIQSQIFDPFFTTKAPGEGVGLGLNISHNIIVQKHQGHITVQSRPGKTCFSIKLPLQ